MLVIAVGADRDRKSCPLKTSAEASRLGESCSRLCSTLPSCYGHFGDGEELVVVFDLMVVGKASSRIEVEFLEEDGLQRERERLGAKLRRFEPPYQRYNSTIQPAYASAKTC